MINTVKLEIFMRAVYFCKRVQFFVKIKPLGNGEIILMFTDVGKSCLVGNL